MSIKQVIIIRKDLNMRKGKIAAQASHASMKVFFERMKPQGYWDEYPNCQKIFAEFTDEMMTWLEWEEGKTGFTKICVSVDSEEELFELKRKADETGLPNAIVLDNGLTEFGGVKTYTCLAIGPDQSEKIDLLTRDLKLL